MTTVSIIIPTYNSQNFLSFTLNSVLTQTYQDFEVIIVDDGSTDGTDKWIEEITDSRVKYISQANQGPAAARNTGIINARGVYLAFLDADDLWHSTKIEKQVNILDNNPEVGLVYSWVGSINSHGKITSKVRKNHAEGNVWEKIIEHNIIECGSNPIVRSICFKKLGKFDPQIAYAQDWEMWLRIASIYQFKVIKEPLVYYRAHDNNRSKKWYLMEENYQKIIEKVFSSVPLKLQKFKNRCYSFAYLRISWKALQTSNGEERKSIEFIYRAFKYYPPIIYSKEYIRLFTAILSIRLLGMQGYTRMRSLFYDFKKKYQSL